MANYTATNSWADLVATNPLGTEDASKIDDALRETRLVAKTTGQNAHSATGRHKFALWSFATKQALTADTKLTLIPTESSDVSGITSAGASNSIIPLAGTYLVEWDVPCSGISHGLSQLYNLTAGSVAFDGLAVESSSASVTTFFRGSCVLVADGLTDYTIRVIGDANGTLGDSAGGRSGGDWTEFVGLVYGYVKFTYLYLA